MRTPLPVPAALTILPAADVDAHVVDGAVEEHQVAGLQIGARYG